MTGPHISTNARDLHPHFARGRLRQGGGGVLGQGHPERKHYQALRLRSMDGLWARVARTTEGHCLLPPRGTKGAPCTVHAQGHAHHLLPRTPTTGPRSEEMARPVARAQRGGQAGASGITFPSAWQGPPPFSWRLGVWGLVPRRQQEGGKEVCLPAIRLGPSRSRPGPDREAPLGLAASNWSWVAMETGFSLGFFFTSTAA